jgi:NTP pyrophosphatase (non-canonical NTP hydrolase)
MVQCKRYSDLIKKIHNKIENISATLSLVTKSERHHPVPRSSICMKDVELSDQITAIVKQNDDNSRRKKLTDLFIHVISLFRKLTGRMEAERDKLLKSIYEHVEKNNSVFFTRQQWLDLEYEYNRLIFIDHFRTKKELLGSDFNKFDIVTLNDILFGPNPFSQLACQTCKIILNENDDDNNDKWKSILLDETKWDDFEKDRLMCDGKRVVCPNGEEID